MGMSREEMYSTGSTLAIAGSETTATLLSGVTYLLLTHPNKFQTMVDEIRAAFNSNDEINLDTVTNLKYMLAVLNEGLRMYPPIATQLNRLAPKGGAMVCGKWVPEAVRRYILCQLCAMTRTNKTCAC